MHRSKIHIIQVRISISLNLNGPDSKSPARSGCEPCKGRQCFNATGVLLTNVQTINIVQRM